MNNIFDITDYNIPRFTAKTEHIYRYNRFDEEADILRDFSDLDMSLSYENFLSTAVKIEIEFLENLSSSITHKSYDSLYLNLTDEIKTQIKDFEKKNILKSTSKDQKILDIKYFNLPDSFEDSINSYITSQNKRKSISILNSYGVSSPSLLVENIDTIKEYSVSNKYMKDIFINKSNNFFSNEINLYRFFSKFDTTPIPVQTELEENFEVIGSKLDFENNLNSFKKENIAIEASDNTVLFNKFQNFYNNPIEEESNQSNQAKCGSLFIGFLIKKHIKRTNGEFQINSSNNFIYLDYKEILSKNKIVLFDVNIQNSNYYSYEILPVFYVSVNNTTQGWPERYHYLICQNSFICDFLSTINYKQPDPPNALRAKYLYSKNKVLLEWDYPGGVSDDDIVGYQVYKRRKLEEPYKLYKYYMKKAIDMYLNFDLFSDIIDSSFIEVSSNALYLQDNMEDDIKSTDDDPHIYAVCSVNAYGSVSNFSNQIAVKYSDAYKDIIIDSISLANAPRQYPNMYLQRKSRIFENDNLLFNFTPFFKNKEKIKIYFTPDCYSLIKNNGQSKIITDFAKSDFQLNLTRLTDLQTKNIVFNFKTN